MSKEDDKFKLNISFEDAMKKAATTMVDQAILIEEKDKMYPIAASGKKVQFVKLTIANKDVSKFRLKVFITTANNAKTEFEVLSPINPAQKTTETILFEHNLIAVEIGATLMVSVVSDSSYINEDFEMGSLSYKISE